MSSTYGNKELEEIIIKLSSSKITCSYFKHKCLVKDIMFLEGSLLKIFIYFIWMFY